MNKPFNRSFYLTILLFCITLSTLLGQESDSVIYQKIQIKAFVPIVIGDSTYTSLKDTIIYVQKQQIETYDSAAILKSENFYNSLQEALEKRRLTKELSNFLLVNRKKNNKEDQNHSTISEGMCFENKIVRSINYIRLYPFGGDVKDPYPETASPVGHYANGVHNKTKEQVIRKNILFKEGDVINDFDLSESERILRALPFIKDAEIYACDLPNNEIDIYVVSKDQWTIGAKFDTYFGDYGAGLYNTNFLGMGQYVYVGGILQPNAPTPIGFDVEYRYNNIGGSFIDVIADFTDSDQESYYGIGTVKDFVSSSTKWAGELSYENVRQTFGYTTSDSAFIPETENPERFWEPHKYEKVYAWAGKSVRIDPKKNRNITLIMGRYREQFSSRPSQTSKDTLYRYQDKTHYIGSLTYNQRNYRKISYLQGFGRNEDVPNGWLFKSTFGLEQNEFFDENRPYIGFRGDYGKFTPWGYFRFNYEFGQFIQSEYKQQVQDLGIHYFTNLWAVKRNYVRIFLDWNLTKGSDLIPGQYLYFISDDIFSNYNINVNTKRGTRRSQLKQEFVWFTPWYFYGFKFAFYQHFEVGFLLDEEDVSISRDQTFTSFGGGIRTRNENLVFNTISLDFKLYPNTPDGRSNYQISVSTSIQLPLFDFKPSRPQFIPFE
ncbi:BamA/TamA family outer membrane protein [Flammeovirga pacifica]|uniref:POTRA domain-containing protein n=1 Tax=Flammeovirga pacifica TaxID=915059 RepID=A0A1S1YYS0_FLAPC|nr:hypothetical protein [Flammeovirga pacifica]OHX66148.1 hypothetical protein NH26_07190 [Flammeovirga pacifica]